MNSGNLSPIPESLNEWTFESVQSLCEFGLPESDRHDFKSGLPDARGLTKLACAFANTFGGFIVFGVAESSTHKFNPIGVDPDGEIYGKLHGKVRAEPEILISYPKLVEIPNSTKVIYIFEILRSTRRPHLPTPADERIFWKRLGPSCCQMTLEEVRAQMVTLEEKREKLTLLLIDLFHKKRSIDEQANVPDAHYTGDVFSFDIIDRAVFEAYSLLQEDIATIGALDTLRKQFLLLNSEKQRVMSMLALSYPEKAKADLVIGYRDLVKSCQPQIENLIEQIERSIGEKFGIFNPYHQV